MNNNMTNERLVQLIKSVEAASSINLKENGDFLENFRQILNEANPDEFAQTQSGQGSPNGDGEDMDYGEDASGMQFSPNMKSNSFMSQIQMEKDPVEVRAQLIDLVRRTPELYDKNDPRYKNNAHKGVLWSRIAREIGNGATGKKVREQWSYMRRKYEEEYHSRLSGNAPTPMDPTKRHLFTYDQLSFLEPYISSHPPAPHTTLLQNGRSESPNDRAPLSHQNSTDSGRDSRNDGLEDLNSTALASNLNQLLMQLAQSRSGSDGEVPMGQAKTPLNGVKKEEKLLKSTPILTLPTSSSAQKENLQQDSLSDLVKRKRKLNNENDSKVEDPQAEIAALNASVLCLSRCLEEVLPKGSDDDCAIFGRQIASDLRQLPKRRRLTVRKQIADLLLQELCENVDQNKAEEDEEEEEMGENQENEEKSGSVALALDKK